MQYTSQPTSIILIYSWVRGLRYWKKSKAEKLSVIKLIRRQITVIAVRIQMIGASSIARKLMNMIPSSFMGTKV